MTQQSYSVTLSTHPDMVGAQTLAQDLVKEGLAACVNILPKITSVYSWQGQVQTDQECLLIIKSAQSKQKEIESYISKHHPYEVPEVIHVPVTGGLESYLTWIG